MKTLAQNLAESWKNGNRKDAIAQILKLPKLEACMACFVLGEVLNPEDRAAFVTLMLETIKV